MSWPRDGRVASSKVFKASTKRFGTSPWMEAQMFIQERSYPALSYFC
jgi:hypothetical protein